MYHEANIILRNPTPVDCYKLVNAFNRIAYVKEYATEGVNVGYVFWFYHGYTLPIVERILSSTKLQCGYCINQ